jgi:putative transposase
MIEREHALPLTRQAKILKLSRSGLYYRPRPVPPADLAVMRRIDELHLDYPFAGSRMLRDLLRGEGVEIGRQRVARMMKRMGIEALYRRPNTSKPTPGHKIYPYLLRGLAVERPNQVWAMDITYIPMARGFVYLAAVVDWFSRRVLAWRVSITMEVEFCLEAVEEALARHGRPEIFNTDQGSQFTGQDFTGLLSDNAIAISMDGKGAWRDNVFVERLWRSVKYEEVYLRAYDSVGEARASIGRYWTSTTASVRIRALMLGHRITPTSTTCRRSRQHEFRSRFRVRHSGRATPSRRATPKTAPRRQPAEVPLIKRENLSRQSRPPHSPSTVPLLGSGCPPP